MEAAAQQRVAQLSVRRRGVVLTDADGRLPDHPFRRVPRRVQRGSYRTGGRGGATATPTTSLRRVLHGEWRRRWVRELGELADALESVKGWVNPWLSSAAETGPNTGLYAVHQRRRSDGGRAHALAAGRASRVGVGARRSTPGPGSVAVVLVVVLPRAAQGRPGQGRECRAHRGAGATSDVGGATRRAAASGGRGARSNRKQCGGSSRPSRRPIDQQGFISWYRTRRVQSSIDIVTITPSAPDLRSATRALDRDEHRSPCTGSYFAVTEFLFQIETLPVRRRRRRSASLPSPSATNASLLTCDARDRTCSRATRAPGPDHARPTSAGGATPAEPPTTPPAGISPAAVTSQGA